jgi:cyclopropane fatty-acyl-phospholipid synthase-like methyltransferase
MKASLTKSFVTAALCALVATLIFFAQHIAWSFEDRGRDLRQKPEEVLKALDLKPGQVIVDLGAGKGYFTWRFARAVGPNGKAIGLEIEADLVDKMESDAKRRGLENYEARLVSADDPGLAPGSVDVVFLCDTYHHIADRVSYFAKIKSSLKPAGKLVILDLVRNGRNAGHSVVREEVVKELRQAGFHLRRELDFLLPRQYFFEFTPEAPGEERHRGIQASPRNMQLKALARLMV